jgi:hypothetical protein
MYVARISRLQTYSPLEPTACKHVVWCAGLHLCCAAPGCASLGEVDPVLPAVNAEAMVGHTELGAIVLIAAMPCTMLHTSPAQFRLHACFVRT